MEETAECLQEPRIRGFRIPIAGQILDRLPRHSEKSGNVRPTQRASVPRACLSRVPIFGLTQIQSTPAGTVRAPLVSTATSNSALCKA